MNICVEGPDNSGKSTLVEALAQIYDRQVKHATKPESDKKAMEDFGFELDGDMELILDRSQAISGYIYDRVVREQSSLFDLDDIAEVARCTLLIICLPPKELVTADNGRDQMKGVNENLSELYDEYTALAYGDHDFPGGSIDGNSIFIFDYTKHRLGDVIDWITDTLGGPLY